jgi:hypothetical protein
MSVTPSKPLVEVREIEGYRRVPRFVPFGKITAAGM